MFYEGMEASTQLIYPQIKSGIILILGFLSNTVFYYSRTKPTVTGPLPRNTRQDPQEEACSIICLNTNPEVVCIANSNGTIYHSTLLPIEEEEYAKVYEKWCIIFGKR